ncbi:MAG TPA: STAS domain-containing protein [Planctomycetota bacterium]|nr:STAS domain-containing protein [Planctomycetota bacterium]
MREPPTVVSLEGDVDYANRQRVRARLLEGLGAERPLLLVDLSGCGVIDSEGLGAFLSVAREVHARGGVMKFCAPSPFVERLLRVTRLSLAYEVLPDLATGLESF